MYLICRYIIYRLYKAIRTSPVIILIYIRVLNCVRNLVVCKSLSVRIKMF